MVDKFILEPGMIFVEIYRFLFEFFLEMGMSKDAAEVATTMTVFVIILCGSWRLGFYVAQWRRKVAGESRPTCWPFWRWLDPITIPVALLVFLSFVYALMRSFGSWMKGGFSLLLLLAVQVITFWMSYSIYRYYGFVKWESVEHNDRRRSSWEEWYDRERGYWADGILDYKRD